MKVITFLNNQDHKAKVFVETCRQNNLEYELLGQSESWESWPCNAFKIRLLYDFLKAQTENELYLVTDAYDVCLNASADKIVSGFEGMGCQILFSAEANFYFREPDLHYYYWKYYPRAGTVYDFLNAGSFIGKKEALLRMLRDIIHLYGINLDDERSLRRIRSDQYVYSRFYADCASGFFRPDYVLKLDHRQELFGCSGGRMCIVKWPLASKIHSFLFFKYERRWLKTFGLEATQDRPRDLYFDAGAKKFHNRHTHTTPVIIHLPATRKRFRLILERLTRGSGTDRFDLLKPFSFFVSFLAYLQSLVTLLVIRYVNKGVADQQNIFRYAHNQNPEMAGAIRQLTEQLENRVPFSFAHYNDGELTFIQKHLDHDTGDDWYGRKQHRYDPKLGRLLLDAFRHRQENYFVGVPCSSCHPEHRRLADSIRERDPYTLPAMTIHHNQSFLPRMLGALRHASSIYYMVNEYQSLKVLEKLGLPVDQEKVIKVPFLNSYHRYDELKDHRFEEGSVVIMTCGMLAKILTRTWFRQNPTCTFLALGSALDDLIQKEKIKYRLFPKDFPFTRNIHPYRSFLFGYKKPCKECFDMGSRF